MGWSAKEDAIHQWLVDSTGLDADKVLWRDQPFTVPEGPYLTMKLVGLTPVGQDGFVYRHLPSAPPGKDLLIKSEGRRHLSLSVQAYSPEVTGQQSALALLARAQNALSLGGVRRKLRAARIAAFNAGAITDLSAIEETRFVARAVMTVQFHTVVSAHEKTTYIATTEVGKAEEQP